MTEKEKTKAMIKEFYNFVSGWTSTNKPDENPSAQYEGEEMRIGRAKQCALIEVNGIIKANPTHELSSAISTKIYWENVKKEIENFK